MARVSPTDAIRYGFRVLGIFLVVFVVGALLFALGGSGSASAGPYFRFAGGLVVLAGLFGALYKIIADAVEQGRRGGREDAES